MPRNRVSSCLRPLCRAGLTIALCGGAYAADTPKPPAADVLNGALWGTPAHQGAPVPLSGFDRLPGENPAAAIAARPPEGTSPALDWEHIDEKRALAQHQPTVSRQGKTLSIRTENGGVVRFVDWKQPETARADGDGVKFRYGGQLENKGYHRVIAEWQHDSPSTYLVDPQSGKALSVHPGDGPFSSSPNAEFVFALEEDAPRWGFAVAHLLRGGPQIELSCVLEPLGKTRLEPTFRGWLADGRGFDMSLGALPLRMLRAQDGWHVHIADPAGLQRQAKLQCTR